MKYMPMNEKSRDYSAFEEALLKMFQKKKSPLHPETFRQWEKPVYYTAADKKGNSYIGTAMFMIRFDIKNSLLNFQRSGLEHREADKTINAIARENAREYDGECGSDGEWIGEDEKKKYFLFRVKGTGTILHYRKNLIKLLPHDFSAPGWIWKCDFSTGVLTCYEGWRAEPAALVASTRWP